MIPFFALITPNHELPSVWLLTNTIKLSSIPGVVIEKLTPYLYKIKLKRVIITANHDRLKLCHDREVPEWAQKLSQQIIAVCNSPTYWSPSGCPVFPGLPNISSAGNPISLPNIIILGVYPVLLFTEDLNAPANCGKYLSQLRSLIGGGILSPLCSGKCVNYFTYINRELPLIVPR
jgi:hypothetical protein